MAAQPPFDTYAFQIGDQVAPVSYNTALAHSGEAGPQVVGTVRSQILENTPAGQVRVYSVQWWTSDGRAYGQNCLEAELVKAS